ncbi:MAG: SpoIID/LytB domain-containing protein [Bacteroidaceae bacterium]|nr:SpoIID/LytB domain-containing protein [Bacteroidaceae bacterium]
MKLKTDAWGRPLIRVGILHSDHRPDYRLNGDGTFTLNAVRIGIDFHWERCEEQTFRGTLHFVADGDDLWAVNELPLEQYLESVVSSEMRAEASLEFLKAHAVIARSWALAAPKGHALFDVCADDHCQRYQGIGRITNENAVRAVRETSGQVLTYGGEICDTRYSKCCGGKTELFSTCWEGDDKPYLQSVTCPYCDTHDADILRQVLNDYDLETHDFHDWAVTYTQDELTALVQSHLSEDIGRVVDLVPLQRGPSGRICALRIVGAEGEVTVGKELAIRRVLSRSHLYSSAFEVEKRGDVFVLHGHGWGHGVGLCQIGAAVMGSQGFGYREILAHYYKNTEIKQLYEN